VCAQPVSVPCYQTVPVTEYQPYKQTVQRPVCRTEYIDEPVTCYRPISEVRTAQVPQCTYQPVTEYIPQTRNCGYWQTYCCCNPKMSPCQYDPNPTLAGWMNRTGYSMRMAFTPAVTTHRRWIPNTVTTMVPVTRQVAQYSTRSVAYNVTRMEAYQSTRKVAVNKVDYVTAEVTMHRPVTVMKTIPIGTSVAWLPFGGGTGTAYLPGIGATAMAPMADPIGAREASRAYRKGVKEGIKEGKAYEREKEAANPLRNEGAQVIPQHKTNESTAQLRLSQSVPTIVRVQGWAAAQTHVTAYQPQTSSEGVSVVDAHP
jgi:hypothetical protein